MRLHTVPSHMLVDMWPLLEDYATRALKNHPFINAEDLLLILLAGKGQLFIATDDSGVAGFAAMEVVSYPRCKVASTLAAGGKRGFLSVLAGPLRDRIENWAAEQGADTFAVIGRPGWLRFARAEGAKELRLCVAWARLGNGRRRRLNQYSHEVGPVGTGAALSVTGAAAR